MLRLQLYQQDTLQNGEKLVASLDTCIEISRDISHNLKSPILEKFGLLPALKDLLDALHQQYQIDIFELQESNTRLTEAEELNVYRICQEVLVNIIKHANASKIEVLWRDTEKLFALIIRDNGVGINTDGEKGIGISNIDARVSYLKAKFKISNRNTGGTSLTIAINK